MFAANEERSGSPWPGGRQADSSHIATTEGLREEGNIYDGASPKNVAHALATMLNYIWWNATPNAAVRQSFLCTYERLRMYCGNE